MRRESNLDLIALGWVVMFWGFVSGSKWGRRSEPLPLFVYERADWLSPTRGLSEV